MTSPNAHPSWWVRLYNLIGGFTFFHWPSWVTELLSGLLVAAAVVAAVTLLHAWVVMLVLASGASVFYELKGDPRGWNLLDVLEREVGIVAGLAAAHWLFHLV